MAGVDGSSDSDIFNATRPKARPYRQRNSNNNNAVDALSSTLQDTNRNLRTVDRMLDCYKDYGEQQSSAMDKLRGDLAKTTERLRAEKIKKARRDASKSPARGQRDFSGRRYPTSPLKDYGNDKAASDNEYEPGLATSPGRRRSNRGAVRFYDDMDADESMHELHQSIRDLHSGQMRLEDDMQRSFTRSNRFEHESTKAMKTIADHLKNSTVEQRLQSLQHDLNTERQMLKQNQDDVGTISTKLHQAIREKKQTKEEAAAMKTRLSVIESERNVIHHELAKTKNRLDRVDVAKHSLQEQVEDLRRALLRSEDSKQKLKEQLDKQEHYIREKQRKLSLDERDKEHRETEMQRMKDEINDLRHQLNKSASALGEFAELRKELDRSEKQRQQLSDHIEVLGKDMEERERQSAKMIHQLQNVTDKFNIADKQRTQLEDNLEEAIRKLKETSKQSENTAMAFRDTQQQLLAVEQRNQELKFKAQETVKQWKAKCKKLEKELHMFRHSAEQATGRSEQLIKELQITKNQSSLTAQQIEHLKREFNTLLAIRAQQEEEVRIRDVQVNELKSFKGDLERDLRDCKLVIERLEHELLREREKATSLFEDKGKYEDSMRGIQQSSMFAQSQLSQLQKEVQDLNLIRVELSAQLATAASERGELKAALKEARVAEHTARDEVDQLLRRIKDNGESHQVMALTHAQKKQRAEYEAELQAVKLELQEEKSSSGLLRRQNDKLKAEIEHINSKLVTLEQDLDEAQRKYNMVRGEFLARTEASEDGLSRAKQLELELLDQKEGYRRAVRDNHNILHTIAAEIDSVVEVATIDSIETYKALSFSKNPSEPASVLAEIKSKLAWIKDEIRERRDRSRRLKDAQLLSDVKETMMSTDLGRNYLIEDITRQNGGMEFSKPDTGRYETPTFQGADVGGTGSSYLPPGTDTYSREHETFTRDTGTFPRDYGTGNYSAVGTGTYQSGTSNYTSGTSGYQSGTDTSPPYTQGPTGSYTAGTGLYTQGTNPYVPGTGVSLAQEYGTATYPTSYRTDSYHPIPPLESDRYKPSYISSTYDSENFTTPASTDGELQMEDLTLVPERLSRAQVFEAMERMTSSESEVDKQSDDSVLRKTQEERNKIHERYAKLQGTLSSLRDELSDAKAKSTESLQKSRDSRSTTRESVSTSPSRRSARRVRISSPPTSEFSPIRRSSPSSRESSSTRERAHRSGSSERRHRSSSRDKERSSSSHRVHSRDREKSSSPSRRSHSHERSPSRHSHSRERSPSRDRDHSSSRRSSERHSHRSGSRERSSSSRHRSHSRERSRERSPSSRRHRDRSSRSVSDERRTKDSGTHRSRRDRDHSPSRRSPTRLSPSRDKLNPLGLTDEEYNAKFLPKAPENLKYHEEPVM